MPNRPSKASFQESLAQKQTLSQQQPASDQYGLNVIPAENLTHITSYLDPTSLFALSGVNKLLHEHVQDDHTWRRAFLLNFLGLRPESDLNASSRLLLRRSESSWMREYVFRYKLRRRWESVRNSTISYVPVHSPVADIHLLPSNGLLCSSLQYGIVSRSILFNGKVLRGFLSPSASGTGLGIGNPNTEFAPDVSACALSSDGGTAKIAWGFRNGEFAVMTANKTMDASTRSAAKLIRCKVEDQHEAEVLQLVWDESGAVICSISMDGRIKIWDAKTVRCLWASDYLLLDSPVTVCLSAYKGIVVAGMRSGDILVWTGLDLLSNASEPVRGTKLRVVCIADAQDSQENDRLPLAPTITSLHLDDRADHGISVLVAYLSRKEFYHVALDTPVLQPELTAFRDGSFTGAVTSILPCLSRKPEESKFIIAGSQMGWVAVYPYTRSPSTSVAPVRKFEAHLDGSGVSALAWNGVTLITGSVNGTTSVFDAYTFQRLRVFVTPVPRPRGGNTHEVDGVKRILLGPEKDVLAVAVGNRVMGFKADVVHRSKVNKKAGKKKARGTTTAKGHEKYALDQLISDSLNEHDEESQYRRRVHGNERQQRENLEKLGLNEVEAVEYILMLSRDEALERERQQEHSLSSYAMDEGVFEGDFDDLLEHQPVSPPLTPVRGSSRTSSSGSLPSISPPRTSSSLAVSPPRTPSRPIKSPPRCSPSSSNEKVQVSPRFREEPREAGWGHDLNVGTISSSLSSVASSLSANSAGHNGLEQFPPMTPPNGSSSSTPSRSLGRGAWGMSTPPSWSKEPSPPNNRRQSSGDVEYDEDEDLKLAIQLSLEEARLRGDLISV